MKVFPLVLPLVLHGKYIFKRRALTSSCLAPPSSVWEPYAFQSSSPILQMLLLSSAGAGYRSDVHSWRKESTMCIFKYVKRKSTLQLLSSSDSWAQKEGGGMEDKQVHLQKGSNWLEAGMPETETLSKGVSFSWWWDKKQTHHGHIATLGWDCSDATSGCRGGQKARTQSQAEDSCWSKCM